MMLAKGSLTIANQRVQWRGDLQGEQVCLSWPLKRVSGIQAKLFDDEPPLLMMTVDDCHFIQFAFGIHNGDRGVVVFDLLETTESVRSLERAWKQQKSNALSEQRLMAEHDIRAIEEEKEYFYAWYPMGANVCVRFLLQNALRNRDALIMAAEQEYLKTIEAIEERMTLKKSELLVR